MKHVKKLINIIMVALLVISLIPMNSGIASATTLPAGWNNISYNNGIGHQYIATAFNEGVESLNSNNDSSEASTELTEPTAREAPVAPANEASLGADSSASESSADPSAYLINDNFENSILGELPDGYTIPYGSGAITSFTVDNNSTVINNNNLSNKYEQTSASIVGNSSNVLWIKDGPARGGFNKTFTPVTAASKKGISAELRFMQPKTVNDSYVLELLDSNNKAALSMKFDFPQENFQANTWYTVKYVANVSNNTAELYINGKLEKYVSFAAPVAEIASINFRMAGSSQADAYVDDIIVYEQAVPTPLNLKAEGANKRAELSWDAALLADSYHVFRSDDADGEYKLIADGVPSNSYSDTDGLENDKVYYYKVSAVGAAGESEYSYYAKAMPNDIAPPTGEISGLKAIVRDSQLTIAWDPVPEATFYKLERSTTSKGPFVPLLQDGQEKITSTSYLDIQLTNGTEYYYKLAAGNSGGSGPSKLLEKVAPSVSLGMPTLGKAEPGNNKVDLNWSSVPNATSYTVKRSEVNGGPYLNLASVKGSSYVDATAKNGKIYYYVVAAENEQQTSMISNQIKAKLYAPIQGAPNKPTGFKATANEGSVSLSWNTVVGATAYKLKRANSIDGSYEILTSTSQTSYEDTSVVNGTTYYYVVAAENANGLSPDTDEIAVLPAKVLTVDPNDEADGINVFHTVQSAINSIPPNNTERTIIYIAPGTYTEKLVIDRPYISLIGAGMDETKIVYGDYAGTSATQGKPGHTGNTFLSQTVEVKADYFTASNLTIENSAGPRNLVAQAVALSVKSDQASFDSIRLIGYQDTLYNGAGRQYFHNSIIQGDVDFIFGEATAVIMDNVKVVLASNVPNGGGHITAGAQKQTSDVGYVFLNSQIVDGASASGTYDLGRPWKDHAKVSFINTFINSNKFLPSGWIASCAGSCKTSTFTEYNSYGPGANASARTMATQLTGPEASLTIPQLFGGWDPTLSVIMPKASQMPSVGTATSIFDKNPAKQADLYVTVQHNGHTLTEITNGDTVLGASAYEAVGNGYRIEKAYLAGLPEGLTTFTFKFGSVTVPLTIHVMNSTELDIGRQVIATNDGWASHTSGTSGGSTATSDNVFIVSKRSELVKAVAGNTPKIVYIKGTIDINVDENDKPIGMEYYKDPAYDFDAYLATYDPTVWGKQNPSGDLETARVASAKKQADNIKINIGSNTTIVGMPGSKAKIIGGNLNLDKIDNVIIRNIEFQNTFDYFPQWDPTDGVTGNWNSAYDSITVKGSTHIWIDHNTFSDTGGLDDLNHLYFGRKYQQHDGLLDITNASDLVTVSYNYFHDHDKTTLVGGSDQATGDIGKLRVTFHHNYYQNIGQRAPRVRFGQVHLYNNYYENSASHPNTPFLYAIGVGYESQTYAENNYFLIKPSIKPSELIQIINGTQLTDKGTMLNGQQVEIAKSYDSLTDVTWQPSLLTSMDATVDVPRIVKAQAGASHARGVDPDVEPGGETSPSPGGGSSGNDGSNSGGGPIDTDTPTGDIITASPDNGSVTVKMSPVKETTPQGMAVLKVIIDATTMQTAFKALQDMAGSMPKIIITVQGSESVAKVQLPVKSITEAQSIVLSAIISVSFDGFTYNLPIRVIDAVDLAERLGVQEQDLTISITIEKVSGSKASTVAEKARQNGLTPVSSAVEVNVVVDAGEKSLELTDFGNIYVDRDIQIDGELRSNMLTALLYDPVSGKFRFVPSTVTIKNGKTTVTMKRPGNSMYIVVQSPGKTFTDLSSGHWAKEDIELLASKLVVQGINDKKFAPDQKISRAEFAALLVRGLGLSEIPTAAFTDIKENDWYAGSVGAAVKAGLVKGVGDGTFRPAAEITREQMAVMVFRAIEFTGEQVSADHKALSFTDNNAISSWAKDAVAKAVHAGIIVGMSDGSFKPKKDASRAEAATMIKRLLLAAEFIN